jgi:DNA (cytosine-5)-methyltransferase 1
MRAGNATARQVNLLSLYTGIGGLDLAAHCAGIHTVAMCEQDAFCRSVLSRHWPGVPIFESDEEVTRKSLLEQGVDRVDIVAGGPPCQPFSVAGKRGGTSDPRHRWPEMARIIADVHPRWVLVENVGGFLDVAKPVVLPDLEGMGYDAWAIEIPAAAVGAPHGRARIFIVAYTDRDGLELRRATYDDDRRDAPRLFADGRDPRAVAVADAGWGRFQRRADASELRDSEGEGIEQRVQREWGRHVFGDGGQVAGGVRNALEFAAGGGLQERLEATAEEIRRSTRRGERTPDACGRFAESRLGGAPAGLSDRMELAARRVASFLDGIPWPAPRYCEQFDHEPPRVTTAREFRRKRVKALGNACPPAQYLPILALIAGVEGLA